ncbi:MAG TPA: response regulator [Candidatus Binatia bacterium]|jgi:CheY-like chemotaxis protein/signal transduction histidine kinase|nr:response regulator [Candidatus Binatia bacterium]
MGRFERTEPVLLRVAIIVSMALVFWIDVITPLGVAEWVFYMAPMALSLFVWRAWIPLLVAAVSSLLIWAGVLLSPPVVTGFPEQIAVVNRTIGVLALWGVAFIAWQFIRTRRAARERDWLREGLTQVATRLQGEQALDDLATAVVGCLCEYLDVPVGALHVVDAEGKFRREGTYALADDAGGPKVVSPGEGLIGEVARTRRLVRMEDVPEGYLAVTSALGRAKPRHVVVAPLTADGDVIGVVELGFFHAVERADLDLIAATAEQIGVALRSVHYRRRLETLLLETQRQAERMQVQQEELRVVNEELEEQSRALRDSQARLEAQQAELEQTNVQLEEQAEALERQRDDLARAQGHLVEKANDLGRASRYKSEFLANMSHELRTPLNSALILSKLLADNKHGNLTAEQVEWAASIYAAGNDLLMLINDILDLSRIEAGRMELAPDALEVAALCETLRRTFVPLARERKIGLTITVADDMPPTLTTDPLRLQQILRNLLGNAIKFTERGEVALDVGPRPGGMVAFAVRDTGIGIPSEQHESIFEAFRQMEGVGNRPAGGTGLGLTISRELARRLGGDIRVTSASGQGSTFTLTVPAELVTDAAAPSTPTPTPTPSPAAVGRAVITPQPVPTVAADDDRCGLRPGERSLLVIEDDRRFARILYDLAHELGYRCVLAPTAAEGLALATQYVPSAIVLDMHLPDHSGLAVLEELKRTPTVRHVPVHVVSVADYAQQALEMGAVGYLQKPLRREDIEAVLRTLERRIEPGMRRVLVVEDVATQRQHMETLLRSDGVEVLSVGTGAEALATLASTSIDCMVLDLSLPDTSGLDLLERMAADDGCAFPPVIVYTGRSLDRDEEQRLRRFASSIVIKGARSPERLLDEVTLFLHQVESRLPQEQQRILREVRSREAFLDGRRLLLVEDDVRNVFALTSVLEQKGARLEIARNGREALTALERAGGDGSAPIELVLMDVMMPEMDGITAMREIRRRPEWRKLPVIALTAMAMADDRDKCLAAGANDYITKPIDVDKLLSLIKVWLPK